MSVHIRCSPIWHACLSDGWRAWVISEYFDKCSTIGPFRAVKRFSKLQKAEHLCVTVPLFTSRWWDPKNYFDAEMSWGVLCCKLFVALLWIESWFGCWKVLFAGICKIFGRCLDDPLFFCSIELVARVWVVNICFYICDCVFWNSILELVVTNVLHYWIDTTRCQIRKGCQLIIHKKAFPVVSWVHRPKTKLSL